MKKILVGASMMLAGSFMFMGGIATVVHGWKVFGTIGVFVGGIGLTSALFGTALVTPVLLKAYGNEVTGNRGS